MRNSDHNIDHTVDHHAEHHVDHHADYTADPKAANKARPGLTLYAALFLAICLIPLVGMAWAFTTSTSGSTQSASPPGITQDNGTVNLYYVPQWGTYFEDHFAYRNLALDIDAHLKAGLLKTSPTNQVIIGSNGWLYYGGELSDYQALAPLTPREASNIAFNLTLMQGYAKAHGSQLIFTIAPNKSTLYPAYMPYYLPKAQNNSIDLLRSYCNDKGVAYLDLFSLFNTQEDELYCKTDSHWNTVGALLVTNALLQSCGMEAAPAQRGDQDVPFYGDIEEMLYPVTAQHEPQEALSTGDWSYVEGTQATAAGAGAGVLGAGSQAAAAGTQPSVEDAFIQTSGGVGATGTLLMFRDSFANNLIPLMAPSFARAYFSKYIPYDLTQIDVLHPDYVIIERAQRHVDLLAQDPALMPAPTVKLTADQTVASSTSIQVSQDGDYQVIQGWVDGSCIDGEDNIFIQVDGPEGSNCYVPFHISGDVTAVTDQGTQTSDQSEDTTSADATAADTQGAGASAGDSTQGGTGSAAATNQDSNTSAGSTSDYGYKAFLPSALFNDGAHTITILVSKADSGTVLAVASTVIQPQG